MSYPQHHHTGKNGGRWLEKKAARIQRFDASGAISRHDEFRFRKNTPAPFLIDAEKEHHYSGLQRLARAVNYCERCGVRGCPLEAHHLTPRRSGGTDDRQNILVVCVPCHAEIDPFRAIFLGQHH